MIEDYIMTRLDEIVEDKDDPNAETGTYFISESGTKVTNPFYEDTGRFEVDPIEEYGKIKLMKFITRYDDTQGGE